MGSIGVQDPCGSIVHYGSFARQDKATSTCTRKLHEASCHELSAAALWIEQGAHRHRISDGAYQCAIVRWHTRANSSNDGTLDGISGFHTSLKACTIYAI